MSARLILASASPRRRELLAALGCAFEVVSAGVDEAVHPGESPAAYVHRVADEKARAVHARVPGTWVLAADTAVALENEILGLPRDAAEAAAMLRRLAGREHRVLTAVVLLSPQNRIAARSVETSVTFRALDDAEIARYVASGEPLDKAGAYGIQGRGGVLVDRVHGSYSNVVGLPAAETRDLLAGHLGAAIFERDA